MHIHFSKHQTRHCSLNLTLSMTSVHRLSTPPARPSTLFSDPRPSNNQHRSAWINGRFCPNANGFDLLSAGLQPLRAAASPGARRSIEEIGANEILWASPDSDIYEAVYCNKICRSEVHGEINVNLWEIWSGVGKHCDEIHNSYISYVFIRVEHVIHLQLKHNIVTCN